MDKSKFSRNNVHDTNMKVVIVRLDFAGVNGSVPSSVSGDCLPESFDLQI